MQLGLKYSIITIDDSRAEYKNNIRSRVQLDEITVPATNGTQVDIDAELAKRGIPLGGYWFSKGELGVWISTFDQWVWCVENNEELVVFEDDAIVTDQFSTMLPDFNSELPSDYAFLSLWVPENQYHDYLYDAKFDEDGHWEKVGRDKNAITSLYNFGAMRISKAYQGYGNVAMQYSPQGAQQLIERAQTKGIYEPIDCFIFTASRTGKIDGYAPKPHYNKAVEYDWAAPTTVHLTQHHTENK